MLLAIVALVGTMSPAMASVAAPPHERSAAASYVAFEVSGKVRCQISETEYDDTAVRCDVQGATFESPPRPDDCPADWGSTVGMTSTLGPRFECVGDALMTGDALAAGEVRRLGDISCTALTDGVSCRVAGGLGFTVTPGSWAWHPRTGKRLLSPGRIGKIKLGMTLREAKRRGAVRRDRSEWGCGGIAANNLKPKYQGAYVVWRRNRIDSIVAWSKARVQTSEGIGVGSSYADARRAYPDAVTQKTSFPFDSTALVVRRGKTRLWMFFTPGYEEPPFWAGTRMELMVTSRSWRPRKELDYHGCGYGS